jgi:hypothetical protein
MSKKFLYKMSTSTIDYNFQRLKTCNIMNGRKMNITNKNDRQFLLIVLLLFFYSHSLNNSICRAHIHARFLADKRSLLFDFVCKPVAKKDYLQKFYDNYLTEKKTTKRNKWYHQHQSTKLVNIIVDNDKKKKRERGGD